MTDEVIYPEGEAPKADAPELSQDEAIAALKAEIASLKEEAAKQAEAEEVAVPVTDPAKTQEITQLTAERDALKQTPKTAVVDEPAPLSTGLVAEAPPVNDEVIHSETPVSGTDTYTEVAP